MKIQLVNVLKKISLLSVMLLVPTVSFAQGQSLAYGIRANIPFDFSVADKKLPSGKYSIGRARPNSDDSILSIADADGLSKAIRISIPVETLHAKDNATLVFHRYGDQYYLFQVWLAGETTGRQFLKSGREREIERENSSGRIAENVTVETVTIVAGLQ
jgi:hypothetical protein